MAPSTAAVRSAIEDGDLARNAHFFADRMGWPVNIDVTRQRLILRTGDILDALLLPGDLADPVALELSASLLAAPVHRDTSDCWWTFITEPRQHPHAEVAHELRAERVHAVSPGEQLVIPPLNTTSWWQPPHPDRPLPPWSAVVAITRRVINRSR